MTPNPPVDPESVRDAAQIRLLGPQREWREPLPARLPPLPRGRASTSGVKCSRSSASSRPQSWSASDDGTARGRRLRRAARARPSRGPRARPEQGGRGRGASSARGSPPAPRSATGGGSCRPSSSSSSRRRACSPSPCRRSTAAPTSRRRRCAEVVRLIAAGDPNIAPDPAQPLRLRQRAARAGHRRPAGAALRRGAGRKRFGNAQSEIRSKHVRDHRDDAATARPRIGSGPARAAEWVLDGTKGYCHRRPLRALDPGARPPRRRRPAARRLGRAQRAAA